MSNEQTGGVLEGRTVLITGAGSGIGKATAFLAAAAGAYVVAADIKNQDATVSEILEAGGQGEAQTLDISDRGSWTSVVEGVLASRGKIDGLANVAGIVSATDDLLTQTEEGWDKLLDVNLKGPFLGMQSVIQPMLDAGAGKIVNVASTAGLIGMPATLAYSASKGGVIAMSRQVAIEYAARNIRVNVVAPGVTQTAMLGDITEELLAAVTAATPTGVLGKAEDVGNAIVFLLSPASDQISGQVLPVDGAWTAQ
jgi:NAD(P)-dependent dehydrogenase (short-subunit alcohol dehydrogenase family)